MSRWHGRAFGLDLESEFPLEGRCAAPARRAARPAVLRLASAGELDRDWPHGSERLVHRTFPDRTTAASIDVHPQAGYLTSAPGFGTFRIARDGRAVDCAPEEVAAWEWQRYLVGQALPLAAVLQGLETFHAGAVAVDGRAVALFGPSCAGKSSLAVGLALRGHAFVADDVVAVEAVAGGLLAHPGAGVASVRHVAAGAMGRDGHPARELGRDDEAIRLELEPHPEPLPLAAVYVLDTGARAGRVEELSAVDPRLLLGATFNFVVRTPERLENQLDVCARIASGVPLLRMGVAGAPDAARLVAALERHLPTLLG